jgi:hypothetical protein
MLSEGLSKHPVFFATVAHNHNAYPLGDRYIVFCLASDVIPVVHEKPKARPRTVRIGFAGR